MFILHAEPKQRKFNENRNVKESKLNFRKCENIYIDGKMEKKIYCDDGNYEVSYGHKKRKGTLRLLLTCLLYI